MGENVSLSRFNNEVYKSLVKEVRAQIAKKRPKIRANVKPIIIEAIYDCPEMESVRGDILKYDFGLTQDPSLVIALSIADTMRLKYFVTAEMVGGFEISVQPGNYQNLYGLSVAYQLTEKGDSLPWLQWLLEAGDAIIIADFGVKYGEGWGRSGGAVMIQGYRPFRVDPSFSGVNGDNFITRALNRVLPKIQETAWRIFTS